MRETFDLEDIFKNQLEETIGQQLHDWTLYKPEVKRVELKKSQYLFQKSSCSDSVYLVIEGLLHLAYDCSNGLKTKSFLWENNWLLPVESTPENSVTFMEGPEFSAQAIEPTLLLSMSFDSLTKWSQQETILKDIFKKETERKLREIERRQFHLLTLSPLDRYHQFLTDYSEIAQRLPQYLIASYIGLTPVSLSRILSPTKSAR